jgi:hypothetical protein
MQLSLTQWSRLLKLLAVQDVDCYNYQCKLLLLVLVLVLVLLAGLSRPTKQQHAAVSAAR